MAATRVDTAMVLAAGLGRRMRPLTDDKPKPLVDFCGRPLIAHVVERLADTGIRRAVVNGHYLADKISTYIEDYAGEPELVFSDERHTLLDTGGGIANALDKLGNAPFMTHNSDTVWLEEDGHSNLDRLQQMWNASDMDCLMLLAKPRTSIGYTGNGDFAYADNRGRLRRRQDGDTDAYVFAGVTITHPRLFENAPEGAFSMNLLWDRAIANGRLFGLTLNGTWMHIGTPDALRHAEQWVAGRCHDGSR